MTATLEEINAMSENYNEQEALKAAIMTEKAAMDFYKYGATKMSDEQACHTFEILAKDEMQHARMFYDVYTGSDLPSFDELMASPPDTESDWWKALQKIILGSFDEQRALELAIDQEEALEKSLRATAAQISDAKIRDIYLANASSTHGHAQIVNEDLKALFGQSR
jgi:rubrerythrin